MAVWLEFFRAELPRVSEAIHFDSFIINLTCKVYEIMYSTVNIFNSRISHLHCPELWLPRSANIQTWCIYLGHVLWVVRSHSPPLFVHPWIAHRTIVTVTDVTDESLIQSVYSIIWTIINIKWAYQNENTNKNKYMNIKNAIVIYLGIHFTSWQN